MIPIVFWTDYTARVQGRVLKLVPCESCNTEYVYILEREGVGAGTSVYGLYDETAQKNAEEGAHESLGEYLANDFDPVPCPTCGHYQNFMFPKLIETRSPWPLLGAIVTLVVGSLSLLSVMYWGTIYLQRPSDLALERLGVAGVALAVAGLIGAGLAAAQRRRDRNFDPNVIEDQPSRIAKGQSRAVTLAEFDALQQPMQPPEAE